MPATEHSLLSSYREMVLEHLFVGELMRHLWRSGIKRMDVLKPQVDDRGYDLVLEANGFIRHVQLKATFRNSRVSRFPVNMGLAGKPGGCVVILLFDQKTLELESFLWFGGAPGKPLPNLERFRVAKHTKGNAQGVKKERPNLRLIPRSAFDRVSTLADVAQRLFGPLARGAEGDESS